MTDKTKDPEYLRIRAAADLLEIDIQTLRRWSKKGLVPHLLTPTGRFIYKKEDITNFYSERKQILKKKK